MMQTYAWSAVFVAALCISQSAVCGRKNKNTILNNPHAQGWHTATAKRNLNYNNRQADEARGKAGQTYQELYHNISQGLNQSIVQDKKRSFRTKQQKNAKVNKN